MSVKGVHASYQFAVKNDVNKKVISNTMSNIQNQNSKKVVVSTKSDDQQKMHGTKLSWCIGTVDLEIESLVICLESIMQTSII